MNAFPPTTKVWTHADTAASYSDTLLEAVYRELRKQNLRNQENHTIRWKAQRLKAVAAERRTRKTLGTYSPSQLTKQAA